MALLLSDRNRKVDNGSRVAMPYKTVVLPSGACISPYKNRLYTVLKDAVLRKNACMSVSIPSTLDKKTNAGSEHNE